MSIQWGKGTLFNRWCWENQTDAFKKNPKTPKSRPPTYTYTIINSKWITGLNVSCKTIKILEENIGSKISDIFCSNLFANITPWARETKEKTKNKKQMGLHETKKLFAQQKKPSMK